MPRTKAASKRTKASRTKRSRTRRPATDANGRQRPLGELSMDYLNLNFMKLLKRYPGEYVIALGNRIIAHGTDLEEVEDRATKKAGDQTMSTVLSFIPECMEDAYIL